MRKIKEFIGLVIGVIRFKLFVIKANMMHAKTGKRYYVLPETRINKQGQLYATNRLVILCKDDIRILKKRTKSKITHLDVMRHCLYFTCNDGKAVGDMDKETLDEKERWWKIHVKEYSKK